ncbi:uncharacterized protein B0P05DRAFT_562321 [Gilbertella persicaria]|nr:uncharacterized protein B0P05DRAFT_562321 [Gilbertella persicaria]KAI8051909.1 hypothetical protein B0P05DRAFT_562321 [Gilbertella persicaria]
MTMEEVTRDSTEEAEFGDIDLSGTLSSVHVSDKSNNLTADRLLDELPIPQHQQPLYTTDLDTSRNTYDQFFEEVSLDLPRDKDDGQDSPSRLMKLIPRRQNSNSTQKTPSTRDSFHAESAMKITTSDISGPFYSISDVLDDSPNKAARESGEYDSVNIHPYPGAARRNVNEAEVVATSGGASLPVRRT